MFEKHKIEGDHYPEMVDEGRAIDRLKRLGLKESLSDPEARKEFFSSLPDEDYKRTLGYINSIMRKKKISYGYEDGKFLEETPSLEDKEKLMNETFEAVRGILKRENRNTDELLRLAGLTLAGTINYIHAYENGNGRLGRVMHYLVEFGSSRGEDAFGEELYAIIAKLPMYDTDKLKAISNSPMPELTQALRKYIRENDENPPDVSTREEATRVVEIFLLAMQDKIDITLERDMPIRLGLRVPAGTRLADAYKDFYLVCSSIPNREPGDAPPGAKRIIAERREGNIVGTMDIGLV